MLDCRIALSKEKVWKREWIGKSDGVAGEYALILINSGSLRIFKVDSADYRDL